MKWGVLLACLLYSLPAYADEVSELKEQVAMLQEQVLKIQYQLDSLVGEKGEQPIEATSYEGSEVAMRQRDPRVNLKLKPGYVQLRREESPTGARVSGGGPGLSAEVDVRLMRRMSFNLTFDGTLDRLGGKQTGLYGGSVWGYSGPSFDSWTWTLATRSLESTDRTLLFVGGPNLRYNVLSGEKATLDFSMGFEALSLQFRAMDKYVTPPYTSYNYNWSTREWAGTLNEESVSVFRRKEKYFGYGPRFGLAANFKPIERLGFSVEGFYTTFLDLQGSRERSYSGGTDFSTEGHAFRFDMGASYEIRKGLSLGAGYRGYLLSIDESKMKNVNSANRFIRAQDLRTDLFYGYLGIRF